LVRFNNVPRRTDLTVHYNPLALNPKPYT